MVASGGLRRGEIWVRVVCCNDFANDPRCSSLALIFINRFFHPDLSATSQLLTDLTGALASTGEDVLVLTSRQLYNDPSIDLPAREVVHGVNVVRLHTSRFGRFNLVGRAVDYLTFYVSAAWHLLRHIRKGDVLVVKTDPPMLSVIVAPIAWLKRAKLVNWLQDLFPEVAMAVGPRNTGMNLSYRAMAAVRDASLRAAAVNIVLGERMAARVSALGVPDSKIWIMPNWADGKQLRPIDAATNGLRRDWGLADRFVIGYSGNLGRAHDYLTFIDAIAEVEATQQAGSQIAWLFIGGGALSSAFEQAVRARGLNSVIFKPYQARDRLAESLSAADVHLVSLRPELEGLIVPSKIYGVLAVGRPTVFIGDRDGEIARLIACHDCGLSIPQGEAQDLARAVLDLAQDSDRRTRMGANARAVFDDQFDRPMAVQRWRDLLSELSAI